MRRPGLTVDVTVVTPVIPASIDEGAGDALREVGVIVDVEEDLEAAELGDAAERWVSFSSISVNTDKHGQSM